MHMAKSLKLIRNFHIIFSYNKKYSKKIYVLACILSFNNQFIKTIRTRPVFQNIKKYILFFLLVSEITNLYVRRIPDIKM
jgi:hypothetical protein